MKDNKQLKEISNPRWVRFNEFVAWYLKQGGQSLTETEIERTVVKF